MHCYARIGDTMRSYSSLRSIRMYSLRSIGVYSLRSIEMYPLRSIEMYSLRSSRFARLTLIGMVAYLLDCQCLDHRTAQSAACLLTNCKACVVSNAMRKALHGKSSVQNECRNTISGGGIWSVAAKEACCAIVGIDSLA